LPDVEVSESEGWTIISEGSNRALWSFPPISHPAYPSVVRTAVVEKDGQVGIGTQVSCGAEKEKCDLLAKDFIELNNKVENHANNE
jgi:hypothetical protein